ncbi:hypothetical protein ACJIZ3_015244 [Penstemon smallii]|uniref:Reverse transcriptase domain-containing protein n=1 Tax=Penstemon smallii TaxID=265156 RepID=A0ABD3RQ97_9LAMI
MSCLAWNCQGLGGFCKVRTLGNLIRDHSPQLIFLSETKLSDRKFERLKSLLGVHGVSVKARGRSGGLALLWPKDLTVVLQSFSTNHIDAHIYDDENNISWRFTGFYGDPVATKRCKSWELLRHLATLSTKPWLCAGDFNAMLSVSEKSGGQLASFSGITEFSDCLRDVGLCDLGFTGYPFTWSNNWPHPHTVYERIDRACASNDWIALFPHNRVVHLEELYSDHSPILIEFKRKTITRNGRRNRGFKFEAMWIKSEDCARVIEESWKSASQGEDNQWGNLETCKMGLIEWSKTSYGAVPRRVKKLKEEVLKLKRGLITEESKVRIKEKSYELEDLLDKEEMLWRQRAKAHWMREGDKNTKFFHAKASSRRKMNMIDGIRDANGVWREKANELEAIVADYFRDIFTSSNPSESAMEEVLGAVVPKVTNEINASLLGVYTASEVKKALVMMHPLKSPGPDGFPVIFYQIFWRFVGSDVTRWVLRFLNEKDFPSVCNFTYIVLIPKCPNPQIMSQFRPISLSNVVYKIASKVIVNRLKPHMNSIISESQSAFVPSRLITDNVLIAYEVSHYMKRSTAEHMAIKLDMSKAYDRIEWHFLRRVMLRLGLNEQFVDLVMLCVSTVTYSFVLNGGTFGFLTPERGIRQGDPLSPYLFLFCSEVLSALFRREEVRGNIAGLAVCKDAPAVSHLLFADDTMIFCNANSFSANSVKFVLDVYEKASGQQVNYQKSSIAFSKNTKEEVIDSIRTVLPMEIVDKHDKYLGLPSIVGKSKKEAFANIRDKVCYRLQGWKEKWLSKGGKEVLLKAVIQAIPSYAMSCFQLPSYFAKEIESLMAKFWWEGKQGKGIHWARWSVLCRSKQVGGLGFRDLETFNKALLAKQLWRLMENPDTLLGKILKARYFPHSDILGSTLGSNPSFTWRSMWGAKDILEAGIRWRIGNGCTVNVWGDKWIPRESTFQVFTPRGDLPLDLKVSEFICEATGQWDIVKVNATFFHEDAKCILSIPKGSNIHEDRRIWHYNKNGIFSVRSAYHLAIRLDRDADHGAGSSSNSNEVHLNDWKWLWSIKLPNKIKIFLWRACRNLLPTRSNLVKRKIIDVDKCVICGSDTEDVIHCLLSCQLARQVWALSGLSWRNYNWEGSDVRGWMLSLKSKMDAKDFNLGVLLCWSIWHARNKLFFEGNVPDAMAIISFARIYLEELQQPNYSILAPVVETNRAENQWRPPDPQVIKLNFDASVNNVDGCCGIGVIARSNSGECVGWQSICIKQPLDPTAAEAKGALMAVEFALARNWNKVILEGDSSVVISAIRSELASRADYGSIIDDIREFASSFGLFQVRHIRREGNSVAHEIAKLSRFESYALNILPDFISNIVISEYIE